jgi:hypothetical protein
MLGLVLSWPGLPATLFTTQLETVYGFLALIGFVTLTLVGFFHQVVPFLGRDRTGGPPAGPSEVPDSADLLSERLQGIGYRLYLVALVMVCAGAAGSSSGWVRAGLGLLLVSLLLFAVSLSRMIGCLRRLQPRSLQASEDVCNRG